jgi:hypothetical protein
MTGTTGNPGSGKDEPEYREWFAALFHSSLTGMARYDAAGHFMEANPALREMLGIVSDHDMKTTNLFDDPALSKAKSQLCNGEVIQIKTEIDFDAVKATGEMPTTKTGRVVYACLVIPAYKAGIPDCMGYLTEIRVAPVKDYKTEVSRLNDKLQVVGSVTRHDIQNQLTAVIGYNELLTMMTDDPKFRGFLEKERQAVDKIRRQLAFSKIYQNIGMETPRWQRIRVVINSVREEVNLNTVKLIVEVGDAAVCADPLFEKVISNLLDNSVRHGGKVTEIRFLLQSGSPNPTLIVEDNGTGIPENEKTKIFERGYGKNTGWGLFVVREILSATGMTIVETGQPGIGARFEIHIPVEKFRQDSA